MSSFTLNQLTEGIRQRHMGAQHRKLIDKWNRTGLLRGLNESGRETMSVLLENQAAQLLREVNTLGSTSSAGSASGDIRGFQNIAFPIVRRVFGGLVANELVSIQPMSLPSGLLFYLDYTYGRSVGGTDADGDGADAGDAAVYQAGQSIYNNPTGKGVRSGSLAAGGQYDLGGSGYSRVHKVTAIGPQDSGGGVLTGIFNASGNFVANDQVTASSMLTGSTGRLAQFDPQLSTLLDNGTVSSVAFALVPAAMLTGSNSETPDLTMIKDVALYASGTTNFATSVIGEEIQGGVNLYNIRRLNQLGTYASSKFTADPLLSYDDTNAHVLMVLASTSQILSNYSAGATENSVNVSFVQSPKLDVTTGIGDALTIPTFESDFGGGAGGGTTPGNPGPIIPEIDIKIESIAVTAVTRKLRARWSPELAQDLNAYHSLDAEVELTQILSEQIALELDREILNDLLTQANGANLFWSRSPGKFVNKETGVESTRASSLHPGPAFTGTVREWYETLVETIIDCANTIHRKTLRGSANFIVVGPDVATILEASVLYKPTYSLDGDGQVGNPMTIGAEKVGSLSNRFTVYKDPYFPRNKILVGYKGGSYLETGYVYAPYVPLIVTPTIFAPEDFTPRKGVMTRYGKKMVRSDFYGTVTCMDMNVI
jgi:hypothetical protein